MEGDPLDNSQTLPENKEEPENQQQQQQQQQSQQQHQNHKNENLATLIKDFKYHKCPVSEDHHEEPMNTICMEPTCAKFLEPLCIQCIDEQTHEHQKNFKSIHKVFSNLCTVIEKEIEENTQSQENDQVWFIKYAKLFKELGEKCNQISIHILEVSKQIYQVQKQHFSVQAKQVMQKVLSTKDDKEFKKLLESLQNLVEVTPKDLKLVGKSGHSGRHRGNNNTNKINLDNELISENSTKKSHSNKGADEKLDNQSVTSDKTLDSSSSAIDLNSQNNNVLSNMANLEQENLQSAYMQYQNKMHLFYDSLLHQLQRTQNSSVLLDNQHVQLTWKFQKSQFKESPQLNEILTGQIFEGTEGQVQVIYSDESFDHGLHGYTILVDKFCTKKKYLHVGIINEEQLNGSPGKPNPNKCLFLDDEYGIASNPPKTFMGPFLNQATEVKCYLDCDNGNFKVYDAAGKVSYNLQGDMKLQGKKWRFVLWWYKANHRVKLLQSW